MKIYETILKRLLVESEAPDVSTLACAIGTAGKRTYAVVYVVDTVNALLSGEIVEYGKNMPSNKDYVEFDEESERIGGRRSYVGRMSAGDNKYKLDSKQIVKAIIGLKAIVSVTGIEDPSFDDENCFPGAYEQTYGAGDGKFAFGMAYPLAQLVNGGNGLIIPDRESVSDDARNSFKKQVSKRKSRKMDAPPPNNKTPETDDDCERRWEEADDPDWEVLDRAYEPSGWEMSAFKDMYSRWDKDLFSGRLVTEVAMNYFTLKYYPVAAGWDPERAIEELKKLGLEDFVKDVKPIEKEKLHYRRSEKIAKKKKTL